MAKEPSRWVIAFINPKAIHTVERDLLKYRKYRTIEPYIPTIKVLVKQVKGRKIFQTLPLLFNYGFFKVPKYFIPNPSFLDAMKKDFECIAGWVKNPMERRREGFERGKLHNPYKVAIATKKEIDEIRKHQDSFNFYTKEDIQSLYIGKRVVLHVYPFEGLPAEILEINEKKRFVKVRLLLDTALSVIKVNFENIFFSMYEERNLDEKMREEYIEELKYKI